MQILLDVDDVLADTVAALERQLGPAVDPTSEYIQDFFPGTDLGRYLNSPNFNRSLPPVPGAIQGANQLAHARHELCYVSARPSELTETTETWLHEFNFPAAEIYCLGKEGKQQLLASESYDLLIDDQLKYLTIAASRGIQALAYAYRWNERWTGARLPSWPDICKTIDS